MQKARLVPFLRPNLDILFIGLNPAKGSNDNGHYFSVNQAFWNQLYDAGLITKWVDKVNADNIIFGNNCFNYTSWQYGITDLVTHIAESNSRKIKPTNDDCFKLKIVIQKYQPKAAILLHGTVLKRFLKFLGKAVPSTNTGALGELVENCKTKFYNIAFPHGNTITSIEKIEQYINLKIQLTETK